MYLTTCLHACRRGCYVIPDCNSSICPAGTRPVQLENAMYRYLAPLLLTSLFVLPLSEVLSAPAQFEVKSRYGNYTDFDTLTRGPFIVWWQNDRDFSAAASELLDTMMVLRELCLNEYRMQDPPNPRDGFFYNIYIHRGDDQFPEQWGNGQGTDANRYPYLTLPHGVLGDWQTIRHETFHIFQYSANSPGFAYAGDSQWYIEATASWFAAVRDPDYLYNFLEAEAMVRMPQVALWLSFQNFPSDYPKNWQRQVHQYGLSTLLYYLSERAGVKGSTIVEGFYEETNELPQEYLFNAIGDSLFRQYFTDWAAHMTNGFDFMTPEQVERNEREWGYVADSGDDYEFIRTYIDSGSGGWYRPDDDAVTRAWAFNTYRVFNRSSDTYTFRIDGDSTGHMGIPSFFVGQVVMMNSESGTTFHNVVMSDSLHGKLSLEVTPQDTALFFIVASVPNYFRSVHQRFGYRMRIDKGPDTVSSVDEPIVRRSIPVIVGRYDLLGRRVGPDYGGLQLVRYSDGRVRKEVGPVR